MLRASKRCIVITEKVNRYGFRALVNGIDLSQYDPNPLLLWMHNRAFGKKDEAYLPIGNVIELKVEVIDGIGLCITGQPMFDDSDDFAISIYNKYENGTLRMFSAGLHPKEWSEDVSLLLPGQKGATLLKSVLEEISAVDIGADANALSIALYDENHKRIQLSLDGENPTIPLIKHPNIEKEMSKIELTAARAAVLLGLKEIGSAEEFETKVLESIQLAHQQKTQIETLTREKLELSKKLEDLDSENLDKDTDALLLSASEQRKITKDEIPYLKGNVKDRAGYDALKLHLDGKPGAPTAKQVVTLGAVANGKWHEGKSWSELDQAGKLIQLKSENINAFKELFQAEFGKEYQD